MTGPEVLIVADDLTGALDTATPFALGGRRVVCAVRPEAVEAALATNADVLVVNTVSRHVPPDVAARIVSAVARAVGARRPRLVFKKIDSRLKGNVGPETAALAEAFGFEKVLVAPAVPDQSRWTVEGRVVGLGLDKPLPIAPYYAGRNLAVEVGEAAHADDLAALAADTDWSTTMAVGARGLGQALAGLEHPEIVPPYVGSRATLFAIGSQDPITRAQVAAMADIEELHAPMGVLPSPATRLPVILRSTGEYSVASGEISARFAAGVVQSIDRTQAETVLLCGGDTALAVLDALQVGLVTPKGEAGPGLPWFELEPVERPPLRAIVKSGGFGPVDALAALLPGA